MQLGEIAFLNFIFNPLVYIQPALARARIRLHLFVSSTLCTRVCPWHPVYFQSGLCLLSVGPHISCQPRHRFMSVGPCSMSLGPPFDVSRAPVLCQSSPCFMSVGPWFYVSRAPVLCQSGPRLMSAACAENVFLSSKTRFVLT